MLTTKSLAAVLQRRPRGRAAVSRTCTCLEMMGGKARCSAHSLTCMILRREPYACVARQHEEEERQDDITTRSKAHKRRRQLLAAPGPLPPMPPNALPQPSRSPPSPPTPHLVCLRGGPAERVTDGRHQHSEHDHAAHHGHVGHHLLRRAAGLEVAEAGGGGLRVGMRADRQARRADSGRTDRQGGQAGR